MTTKAQKKLVLNKETLRNLKDSELAGVAGGRPPPTGTSCTPTNCAYTDYGTSTFCPDTWGN